MYSIFKKEIHSFFSSLVGYMVIAVFLVTIGLFMWVFSETSVIDYHFATMDQLFSIAPLVFLFLIPAITMRSFAEEKSKGTIEFLYTKPLSDIDILMGKFFANFGLVVFALIPTLVYYFSIYQLGAPKGNLDTGSIIGSYIGLFFLGAAFVAISMFASSLTKNQITSFIFGAFLCFVFHWAFSFLAGLPMFQAGLDAFIQKLGINHHYSSISKGLVDTRDLIYFISIIAVFLYATYVSIKSQK
jgi:ABC-2 type transport system permease protein